MSLKMTPTPDDSRDIRLEAQKQVIPKQFVGKLRDNLVGIPTVMGVSRIPVQLVGGSGTPTTRKPKAPPKQKPVIPKSKLGIPKRKRIYLLIALLGVILLIFGLMNLATSDLTAPLRGTGNVLGVALDAQGLPFRADIFVEGTELSAKANADGSFDLKNIPAGQRLVVVADGFSGREFPVTIIAGQTTDMGKVQLIATPTP